MADILVEIVVRTDRAEQSLRKTKKAIEEVGVATQQTSRKVKAAVDEESAAWAKKQREIDKSFKATQTMANQQAADIKRGTKLVKDAAYLEALAWKEAEDARSKSREATLAMERRERAEEKKINDEKLRDARRTNNELARLDRQRAADARKAAQDLINAEKSRRRFEEQQIRLLNGTRAHTGALRDLASAFVLVDGPLGGVASRLTTLGSLLADNTTIIAGTVVAFAALGAGMLQFVRTAGELNAVQARIRLVTSSTEEMTQVTEGLFAVAQRQGTSFVGLQNFYAKLGLSAKDLGLQQKELLGITEAMAAGFKISGTNAVNQSAALLQLSQALGSGRLNGDEFNSMAENASAVLREVGRQLQGVIPGFDGTIGALREMAGQGKLTSEILTQGLLLALPELRRQAEQLPPTLTTASEKMKNAFVKIVSEGEKASGAVAALAKAIDFLANNLDTMVRVVSSAAIGALSLLAVVIGGKVVAAVAAAAAGFSLLGAAILTVMRLFSPIGLAVGVATAAFYLLKEEVSETQKFLDLNITSGDDLVRTNTALETATGKYADKLRDLQTVQRQAVQYDILRAKSALEAANADYEAAKAAEARITNTQRINPRTGQTFEVEMDYDAWKENQDKRAKIAQDTLKAQATLKTLYDALNGKLDDPLEGGGSGRSTRSGASGGGSGADRVKTSKDAASAMQEEISTLDTRIRQQRELNEALAQGKDVAALSKAHERDLEVQQKIAEYKKAGVKNAEELGEQYRERLEILDKEDLRHEEINKKLEESKRLAQEFGDSLEKSLEEAVHAGLTDGVGGFLQGLRDQLVRGLAGSIAGSIRGAIQPNIDQLFGIAGSGGAGGVKGAGGSFSYSDILSVGSKVLDSSVFGGGSSVITSSIDKIGYDVFGIGSKVANPYTGAAPFGESITGGVSSLGTIGNLAGGFAGNLLGGAVFGDTGLAGSILSGLGGLGGAALFGAGGALAGTGVATALGSFAGPAGALVGAFAGQALGSLFGGSRPHPAATAGTEAFTANSLGDYSLNYKHLSKGDAQQYATSFDSYFASLAAASGADLSTLNKARLTDDAFAFAGGIDDGTGFLSLGTGNKNKYNAEVTFDPNDEAATQAAFGEFSKIVIERVAELGGEVDETLLSVLDNIKTEGRSLEEVMADISFAANFDQLGVVEEELTEVEVAFDNLNKVFDEAQKKAAELGLSEQKVIDIRAESIARLRSDYLKAIMDESAAALNPRYLAEQQEIDRYNRQLKEAEVIGGDTTAVLALHKIRMQQIHEQYQAEDPLYKAREKQIETLNEEIARVSDLHDAWGSLFDDLEQSIKDLRLGELSTLSPLEKVNEARDNFRDLVAKSKTGTPEEQLAAASQLSASGQTLLELSRGYYASSSDYAADFTEVEAALNDTKDLAQMQYELSQSQLTSMREQVNQLEILNGKIDQAITQNLRTSIANPALMVSQNNANELVLANRAAIEAAGKLEDAIRILEVTTPGIAPGGGARSLFYEGNQTANAAALAALQAAGIPGFAEGGNPSLFSPSIVGERGPEIIVPRNNMTVIPMENSMAVLRQMQMDGNAMRRDMAATQELLRQLIAVTMQSKNAQYEQVEISRRTRRG